MDFSILNFQFFKKFKISPKIVPNHPKSIPKPSQIRPKMFDFFDFFGSEIFGFLIYGKILDKYRKMMGKICTKWAHNGPFELSAGHREHRE